MSGTEDVASTEKLFILFWMFDDEGIIGLLLRFFQYIYLIYILTYTEKIK